MKSLKHTFFLLISLLFAAQAIAQPDTRRMNISIGVFSPSATSYDYEGAIGVVGSTGYDVDDIVAGEDMFWDDRSRYRVDSVEIIVAGTSATVWVTDLYTAGAPQSGKGTLGKPSPNTGIQPLTENGSNFITEAQEAKIMTDNLNRLDSLGGDGNGIYSGSGTLPGAVTVTSAFEDDFYIKSRSGVIGLGDIDGTSTESYLEIDNDGEEILVQAYSVNIGYWPSVPGQGNINLQGAYIEIGDPENDGNRTQLTVDDESEQITLEADLGIFLEADNGTEFSGLGYGYLLPTTNPTANQVLGEGATDDDILEWVDPPVADGNGIIDALPAGGVTVAAAGNALQVNGTSLTRFTADGAAEGELVVSGASAIPSSLSHIEGVDTAKVLIRGSDGVGLKATGYIDIDSDSILMDAFLMNKWTGGNFIMSNDQGRWDIQQKGSAGVLNIYAYDVSPGDPIGLFINGTTGALTLGDRDSDVHQGRLQFYTNGDFEVFSGNSMLSKLNNIITLGDEDGSRSKIVVDPNNDDDIETVRFIGGDFNYYCELELDDNTEVGTIALGMGEDGADQVGFELLDDFGNDLITTTFGLADQSWSVTYINDTDAETFDFTIGDKTGTKSGTKITMSNEDAEITLNANSGTVVSGAAYTYTLPVTTPTAADSLRRVMTWKEGEVGTFQVFNGANYRTATATGNILPYDDYVEVDPNVTVHLPAPSAAFRGKVFHVIAGGGTGGGSPGTIDVVDGSSTIETGTSLTLDTAFESYTLVCNGSQWIVLNNKP